MKTIKIIDLLNKIANGEEVPKYIRYRDISKHEYNIMMVCKENIIFQIDQCVLDLNDEVEIIEEEKEIEKIEFFEENLKHVVAKTTSGIDFALGCFVIETDKKINELIETVNEIKRG